VKGQAVAVGRCGGSVEPLPETPLELPVELPLALPVEMPLALVPLLPVPLLPVPPLPVPLLLPVAPVLTANPDAALPLPPELKLRAPLAPPWLSPPQCRSETVPSAAARTNA
jgi:hypothetical protein